MRTCFQNALQFDSQNPSLRHRLSKESSSSSSIQRTFFFLNFLRGRHRDHLPSRIRNCTSVNSLKKLWWATITRPCPQRLFFLSVHLFLNLHFIYLLFSFCLFFLFPYTVLDLVFSLTIFYLCVDRFNSIFLCWGPCGVFFFFFSKAATFFFSPHVLIDTVLCINVFVKRDQIK